VQNSGAPGFAWARIWDALALVVIAFAVWKILIAPRVLLAPHAFPAPHASYPRLDGGTFRLADYRSRPVFLDFYASWCEPCRLEMPLVEAWSQRHPDALVVPIDVGESRATASAFARRFHLPNVALDPESSAPALFSIVGFPTVVAIDRNGDIRGKWEGLNPAIGLAMSNAEKKF
jgi:thiol-disulfide isomerase/thioredoxin